MLNTNKYAHQHNITNNVCDNVLMTRFIGFLIFTGYHTVPQFENYWSNQPDLGIPLVKNSITRAQFRIVKQNIHLCDNDNHDKNDRFAKVRPLLEILNKKFMQFGVFHENLSIDEQMVPYFGRHSCKMFIRGKPIRFGFKLWVLASSEGFIYYSIPYAGASQEFDKGIGLGAHVVLNLLKNVAHPQWHYVFFDNFFSSFYLMCLLTERNFSATGTVRRNRLPKDIGMKTDKQLKKGIYFIAFFILIYIYFTS